MSLQPYFSKRVGGALRSYSGKMRVNSMSWHRLGGAQEASLTVFAGPQDLADLVNLLRCGVELRDGIDNLCWWGFVHEVQVRIGAIEIGASLASMYNRVAVAYSYVEPGSQLVGQRKTTAWADNLDSQAEYGVKELLHMGAGMSDAAAEALRDVLVAQRAWPQGSGSQGWGLPRGRARYSGAQNSLSATLLCRGWYETLRWDYPSVAAPEAAYRGTPTDYTGVYAAAGSVRHAQSFTVGSQAIVAVTVGGQYRRVGTPGDNLVVALQADTAGAPSGVDLASATLAGATLETSCGQINLSLGPVTLAAGTKYWIVWKRSGALDATNYVQMGLRASTGYAGEFKTYDGAAWGGASIYTAYFVVLNGDTETTQQIADLVTASGQFLTGLEIEAASGVTTGSFLDGNNDGMTALEALLGMGGANGRRLNATVTPELRLRIWEEPANSTVEYQMDRWGRLFAYPGGDMVDEFRAPVGAWVRIADLAGANANLGMVSDPTLQYIEGAAWSEGNGTRYTFRGEPGLDNFLRLQR